MRFSTLALCGGAEGTDLLHQVNCFPNALFRDVHTQKLQPHWKLQQRVREYESPNEYFWIFAMKPPPTAKVVFRGAGGMSTRMGKHPSGG